MEKFLNLETINQSEMTLNIIKSKGSIGQVIIFSKSIHDSISKMVTLL